MKKYFSDGAGQGGSSTPPANNPQPVKSTAWISYLLAVLVFGGVGYYIYQGLNKNKTAAAVQTEVVTAPDTTATVTTTTVTPAPDTIATTTTTTTTVAPTTTPTSTDPEAIKKAEAAKKAKELQDKKAKQLAEAKKKEEEKKKQEAREREMRNNWARYVTVGALNFVKDNDDGIREFAIPVSNATSASLDKVTIRVDYLKKEGKITKTETLTLSNIPAKGMQSIMAPANKKAKKANVYITGISSRGLHFCYPVNNGNATDPYFCN